MKILMVNKFLHSNGGSETYIFELGKQLGNMGHEVQYFGMEHSGRCVGNHVESYTSDMDFHTGKLSKLLYPLKIIYSIDARKKIGLILKDFEPDVVHLNNFNFQLTPSIIYEIKTYSKKMKKKIQLVYTAHDYQLLCPNHMMKIPASEENCERCLTGNFIQCTRNKCIHNSRIKSLLGSIEGYVYKFAQTYQLIDTIICPSRFMEHKFLNSGKYEGKTRVLYNFVNKTILDRKESDKKEYILYFGRYSNEKGILTLLQVCKKLPQIQFIFAGTGPLEGNIEEISNIVNVGFQTGAALHRLIEEALLSIYPSEWYENCPFSVMESIIHGTPVVGAAIGGIPELIVPGRTGVLFESRNARDLEAKIIALWSDKEALKHMSINCRETLFDSPAEYSRKLVEIYKDI